jgi:hypothetical protein
MTETKKWRVQDKDEKRKAIVEGKKAEGEG